MVLRGKPDNTSTIKMTKDNPNTQFTPKLFHSNCRPNIIMQKVLIGLLEQNTPYKLLSKKKNGQKFVRANHKCYFYLLVGLLQPWIIKNNWEVAPCQGEPSPLSWF